MPEPSWQDFKVVQNEESKKTTSLCILGYQGVSWISKAIRWQTRSRWSHAALCLWEKGTLQELAKTAEVIEAWHIGGVRAIRGFWTDHDPKTQVDVFTVQGTDEAGKKDAWAWAQKQIGAKYDYRGVLRFVSRRRPSEDDKLFCSELAFSACELGGVQLLRRIQAAAVSPGVLMLSPLLHYVGSVLLRPDGTVSVTDDLALF